MLKLKFSPLDVECDTNGYIGEFWINSGAFIFPIQGWRDDVPARLVDFAGALSQTGTDAKPAVVTLCDAQHRVSLHQDPADPAKLRITYADRVQGGLLYQEKIAHRDLQTEVARGLREMLEVCVRRHWSVPASAITEAMDLPGMRRQG